MSDLYSVLQVHCTADRDVIRSAYRVMARRHHPDFGGDPKQMASINEAWAVLGDQARRNAYDAAPEGIDHHDGTSTATTTGDASRGRAGRGGLGGRPPQEWRATGSVLDFGRYAGWTVGSLVDHDPGYLEWLSRTPFGRRLSVEIDAALVDREAQAAALRPVPSNRRRGFFRTASAASR